MCTVIVRSTNILALVTVPPLPSLTVSYCWVLEGLRYDGKWRCGRSEGILSLTESSRPTGTSSKEEGHL